MSGEGGRRYHPECHIEVDALGDSEPFECDDAEVWVEAEAMLISYFDDEGIVVLEGWHADASESTDASSRATDAGDWTLAARSRPRRAFLRRMADAPGRYEGEIEEQGETAGWRLRLGPPEAN